MSKPPRGPVSEPTHVSTWVLFFLLTDTLLVLLLFISMRKFISTQPTGQTWSLVPGGVTAQTQHSPRSDRPQALVGTRNPAPSHCRPRPTETSSPGGPYCWPSGGGQATVERVCYLYKLAKQGNGFSWRASGDQHSCTLTLAP